MMRLKNLYVSGAAVAVSLLVADARALDIDLDFSQDTTGFFTANPLAKAALEAAAQDLSNVILTPLGSTVDTNSAVVGVASASFDFEYSYTHPTNGSSQTFNPAVLPADTVTFFVGARTLAGSTLGQGGPGGAGVSAGFGYSGSIPAIQADTPVAWDQALTAATANIRRGGGPVFGNLSDTLTDSNGLVGPFNYDLDFGLGVGNLWFDDDAAWHFNHTTSVADNKFDFYSVALHELLHSLGIGSADSWDDLVSPGDSKDWLGGAVIALLGDGDDILEADSNHIAEGTLSTSILNGQPQEAAMDPSLSDKTRKHLTALDLAFLTDIGWTVIPEPTSLALLAGATVLLIGRRRDA